MSQPIVAIVGRPNVGKSTLFNRLAGSFLAIVEDKPGTTRDRLYDDIVWRGCNLTLVDTGGLETKPTSDLTARVKAQVEAAIEEADALILVVDVKDGITAADLDIAEWLRRSGRPLVLAANKADNPTLENAAVEFYQLGLGEPLPISAYHRKGSDDLMERVIALLPPSPPPAPEPPMMKVAIVGRPNVGKSTLLNALLGKERAIVSEVPGTTRDALDTPCSFDSHKALLIDTAGIRRRGHIGTGVELYSTLRALRAIARSDVTLLLLDAIEGITAQDAHIAGYIHQAGKGMVLLVNKWDVAPTKDEAAYTQAIQEKLRFMPYVPILFISAMLGKGVKDTLPIAYQIYQERQRLIPHAELAELMQKAVSAHPPPTVKGKQLKVLELAQTEVNPPTFTFYVNDPKLMHFSYTRYLENRLRQSLGFFGTPLRLIFKRRSKGRAR